MSLLTQLKRIVEQHEILTRTEAADLLGSILQGEATELELAALLAALAIRGETPTEIAGFVDAMRAAATPIPLTAEERSVLVDSCGTGGDHSNTFNISTAAALVAAAAGATVAKHGNRAVTSRSGSADVLEALGIPVDLDPVAAADALRRHRFAYLHAPSHHPAAKVALPVRRALGIRTIFNILGPLSNPAGAQAQVMGVYSAHLVPIVAETMVLLGTRHAFVVHGDTGSPVGGMDELSISGPSQVAEVRDGAIVLRTLVPEDFGVQRASMTTIAGSNGHNNAAILRSIFTGEIGPRRDIVLLNAAAVLVAADCAHDLPAGLSLAVEAIDSGRVTELVANLGRIP
ncbi:anthranilate phosphoribosyltransferase [Granulicella arctica]|uniref:anthranilate phosphoribosyltransferase n=1 Tax=Granulicella arctica TaxID=940613 RepID=UPI0021DFF318|nr:anthranilate phosphoribosyltransferase [Granulicella arctica]